MKSRTASRFIRPIALICLLILSSPCVRADELQQVEGFDKIEYQPDKFNYHMNGGPEGLSRDFRGMSKGYMTAAWWSAGQMKDNRVAWKTAAVPEAHDTAFSFIASSSVVPTEFTRGPLARLSINEKEAITFPLGNQRNMTWKKGDFELKFTLKRLEFPYTTSQRQSDLIGISGIYQLKVPASAIEAGKPATLQVELLPFEDWNNGWFMVKSYRDVLNPSAESLKGEIESLRQDVIAANQQTQALASKVYADLLDTHDLQHEVIYRNGFRHLHPADLIKLKNGDLLIMAREGTEHIANDGDVIMLRSKDGGKTWGDKTVIAATKDLDEREGCGVQLKDGTIVVGVFYNNLYGADGAYRSKPTTTPAAWGATTRPSLGSYIITSRDDGKTWSEPNYINPKGMPFSDIEGPTDAPIEMPDGSIVMGVIGYRIGGDAKNIGSVLLRSEDQGKTWKYLSTIGSDPGGKLGGLVEPGIVRTKSGRILAAMRNQGEDQAIWVSWSDDDGKTFTPVKETTMIGHPADLVQLSDGRILCSYGIRTAHAKPQGIRACFSNDNGETWDIKHEVVIRSDFMNWDVGYPESMEMPDGRVLTVYYYNLFNKYFLGGTSWKP